MWNVTTTSLPTPILLISSISSGSKVDMNSGTEPLKPSSEASISTPPSVHSTPRLDVPVRSSGILRTTPLTVCCISSLPFPSSLIIVCSLSSYSHPFVNALLILVQWEIHLPSTDFRQVPTVFLVFRLEDAAHVGHYDIAPSERRDYFCGIPLVPFQFLVSLHIYFFFLLPTGLAKPSNSCLYPNSRQ